MLIKYYEAERLCSLQSAVVNGKISSPPLLLDRQSFYLSLRFYRNCSVSDNSVCVREKEKEVIFCPESSQSFSSEPGPGWITTINKEESDCFAGFSLTELSW